MHMDITTCKKCGSTGELLHEACYESLEYCLCDLRNLEVYICLTCQDAYEVDPDELSAPEPSRPSWSIRFSPDRETERAKAAKPIQTGCRHSQKGVLLADKVPIYCSSYSPELESVSAADYGLYADHVWRPVHRNEFIAWPDFGIPNEPMIALDQIQEAYERARDYGEAVQIGCIGGHGRTGTILACMFLLSGEGTIGASEAIDLARKNYCSKAIENDAQEGFVRYAACVWYDTVFVTD